jgi:hypothetical protein
MSSFFVVVRRMLGAPGTRIPRVYDSRTQRPGSAEILLPSWGMAMNVERSLVNGGPGACSRVERIDWVEAIPVIQKVTGKRNHPSSQHQVRPT